jgi:outer membrane protein OmpA-like peptidoglycan-associated protein
MSFNFNTRLLSRFVCCTLVLVGSVLAHLGAAQQQAFADLVGPVSVQPVQAIGKKGSPLQVPFITWGGDMVTFHANGGLKTHKKSIYNDLGLELQLKAGDDFVGQVRDYLNGTSPFLRGTYRMMGMASEVISQDPRTQGVAIMQLTWSAGDHLVARKKIKTISDLKGSTIVLQQGGPHVGMLADVLSAAQLSWDDITIRWAKDLTGTDDSSAEIFRRHKDVDACFVITPDMIGLNGGLQDSGTGAEGTVKGARVLVSTAELSRSIADVYVVRKDFYDANKDMVTRFVAGYFQAAEQVLALKKDYESKGSADYQRLLQMTQDIYGKEILPTLEGDVHGLFIDCTLPGYPGNVAFFTEKGNLNGFGAFNDSAQKLATEQGFAKQAAPLLKHDLDYRSALFTGRLKQTQVDRTDRFRAEAVIDEIEALTGGTELDDKTILSFTIYFDPNQQEFSAQQYAEEYERAVRTAAKFGNAVVAIRGHSDPTKCLVEMLRVGMKKGIIKRSGNKGNYRYAMNGRPLDIASINQVIAAIKSGQLDGDAEYNPRQTMQAALNLSRRRAENVRDSMVEFAQGQGLQLDASQIQPVGVGIREPFIARPRSLAEARENMRVEFRLVRVDAEALTESDFDF